MMKVSVLELRMLLVLASALQPAVGKGLVKYVNACRHLEKKGLAGKGRQWYITNAGERFVKRALNADDFELTAEEKQRLSEYVS